MEFGWRVETLRSQRLNKDVIANLNLRRSGAPLRRRAVERLAAIFDFVMQEWKWKENLAPGLEHARNDTDTRDDTDGPLIACGSPYCPCASSTAAGQVQASEESDVTLR